MQYDIRNHKNALYININRKRV